MKIWLVLYFAGKVAGVWGPMNNITMEECQQNAETMNRLSVVTVDEAVKGRNSKTIRCWASEAPPKVDSRFK